MAHGLGIKQAMALSVTIVLILETSSINTKHLLPENLYHIIDYTWVFFYLFMRSVWFYLNRVTSGERTLYNPFARNHTSAQLKRER